MKKLITVVLTAFTISAVTFSALTGCASTKTEDMPEIPGMGAAPKMNAEVYKTGAAKVYENVSYATVSKSEVCDIYIPEGDGKFPVLLLVHGGGFAFETQRMSLMESVAKKAIANGYAVVAVDYRKSGEAQFPGALSDVKAAVRFVRANAEKYGFDTERIAIWGESAGAYLSLMTALTPEIAELNGDVSDNAGFSSAVNAFVDFYGPVEFYTMDDEYAALGKSDTNYSTDKSFESRYLGQAIGEDKETTYKTYWETYKEYVPKNIKAWIQAGTADNNVPYTQGKNFAERLSGVIGSENVKFGLIEGAAHMDAAFYTEDNLNAIFDFLESALK